MKTECHQCQKTDEQSRLHKCPICFRYYCDDHAVDRSGVRFCSKGCADYFFFGDSDD